MMYNNNLEYPNMSYSNLEYSQIFYKHNNLGYSKMFYRYNNHLEYSKMSYNNSGYSKRFYSYNNWEYSKTSYNKFPRCCTTSWNISRYRTNNGDIPICFQPLGIFQYILNRTFHDIITSSWNWNSPWDFSEIRYFSHIHVYGRGQGRGLLWGLPITVGIYQRRNLRFAS